MANLSVTTPESTQTAVANLSVPTPASTQKGDEGDAGLFSTRNLIIGGVVLGGLVAAVVSYSFNAFRKPKSSKKTKSKKKKSSKAKTGTGTKTDASASKPTKPAPKSTDAVASKSAIAAPPTLKKKEEDTAAVVEDIDEPSSKNLQTEGSVSNEVFQSFLSQSNKMLKASSMKDKCAAVYKSGGNVGKYLQKEQGVSVKHNNAIDAASVAGCEFATEDLDFHFYFLFDEKRFLQTIIICIMLMPIVSEGYPSCRNDGHIPVWLPTR